MKKGKDKDKDKSSPILGDLTKTEYNKLKKDWYSKLKEEGFQDIEGGEGSWGDFLTTKNAPNFRTLCRDEEGLKDKATYYNFASKFYMDKVS